MNGIYENKTEFGRVAVRAGKTGWIVETDSRWQGAVDGQRLLLSYGASEYSPSIDLESEINGTGTIAADAIRYEAQEALRMSEQMPGRVRVLRRGHVVR